VSAPLARLDIEALRHEASSTSSARLLRPIILARLKDTYAGGIAGVVSGTLSNGIIRLFVGPIVLAVGWDLLVAFVLDNDRVST
jgi:hypothetical protein